MVLKVVIRLMIFIVVHHPWKLGVVMVMVMVLTYYRRQYPWTLWVVHHHHYPWKFGGGDVNVMMVVMHGRYAGCCAAGGFCCVFIMISFGGQCWRRLELSGCAVIGGRSFGRSGFGGQRLVTGCAVFRGWSGWAPYSARLSTVKLLPVLSQRLLP